MAATSLRLTRARTPEFGIAGGLAVVGVFILVDASQIPSSFAQRGPVGPAAVPYVIGIGLLVIAVLLALEVLRGRLAQPESGEDVELGAKPNHRAVLLITGSFLANAVLVEPLGWPLSGAVLFWTAAYALGSQRHILNIFIAFALSIGSYLMFAMALGVELPVGPLGGLL